MGLIVLPAEVLRLWPDTQAASLGLLLAMTGITQLIAPVVGYLSDRTLGSLGKRRPYMLGGGVLVIASLTQMRLARDADARNAYAVGLFWAMMGLNVAYAGFTGLLPDLVPSQLMGRASGLMAVLNAVGAALSFWVFGVSDVPEPTLPRSSCDSTPTGSTGSIALC